MNSIAHLFLNGKARNIYTYTDYMLLMEQVVRKERTTGPKQSAEMNMYTKLNLHRMQRLNRTVVLNKNLTDAIGNIHSHQIWYILTEAWCGDAAQIIPVIALAASINPAINIKILLRDENPDLMDLYLTNGGRSIPKLIAVDRDFNELFHWGPRPSGAQVLLQAYKANPEKSYQEFSEEIQRWYNADKTQSFQKELLTAIEGVLTEK